MAILTEQEALGRLRAMLAPGVTQAALAERFGVSGAYLSDVLHERRAMTDTIAAKIGLRRVVRYVEDAP